MVVPLPSRYFSATWHSQAGPNHLLAVELQEPWLHLQLLDLSSGAAEELGVVEPITDAPLALSQCGVSEDGRYLLGISQAGWTQARLTEYGASQHATVIDLESMAVDLPLQRYTTFSSLQLASMRAADRTGDSSDTSRKLLGTVKPSLRCRSSIPAVRPGEPHSCSIARCGLNPTR